jgi:hypothetical protein
MLIDFVSTRFKNILSYGNNITEFNYQKGLNLITASNGSGKCVDENTIIEIEIDDAEIYKKMREMTKE